MTGENVPFVVGGSRPFVRGLHVTVEIGGCAAKRRAKLLRLLMNMKVERPAIADVEDARLGMALERVRRAWPLSLDSSNTTDMSVQRMKSVAPNVCGPASRTEKSAS
jgi:hypothetical protein